MYLLVPQVVFVTISFIEMVENVFCICILGGNILFGTTTIFRSNMYSTLYTHLVHTNQ